MLNVSEVRQDILPQRCVVPRAVSERCGQERCHPLGDVETFADVELELELSHIQTLALRPFPSPKRD